MIGNFWTWRTHILIITMIEHPELKPYHLKPQNFKHVENKKVSGKPTYVTSMERS